MRDVEERKTADAAGELTFEVPDMDCVTCARRISDSLNGMPGVRRVEPRIVSKDVRVEFDPERTDPEAIASAVRDLGYTVKRDRDRSETRRVSGASVWKGRAARRTYLSGLGIGIALALRLLGLSPLLVAEPWRLDLAGLLLTGSALVGGLNFFPKGLRAARIVRLDMNFLMTVAIFGALLVGEFVEAASIAFLFGIAELLEVYSVERARRSIEKLLDLTPVTARVKRNGGTLTIPVEQIALGDTVQVLPGEKIPIDGWVSEGASSVDQSPITGESVPVPKLTADYVYAGSMNREGYLEIEAAKRAGDTTLAHIIHLVEEAEASRSPSERFVERFARHYTPAVTALAVVLMLVPPLLIGAPFSTWFVRGLTLLVISCPCALVISTPVAVVSAITSAARNGVLIKGGVHLETLAAVRAVAFDKTGTLTTGQLDVTDIITAERGPSAREVLEIAAALADRSHHPISAAVSRRAAALRGISLLQVSEFEEVPGRGVRARIDGRPYQLGRTELFADGLERWRGELDRLAAAGQTPVCLGDDRLVLALIAVSDRERVDGRHAIQRLRELGIGRIVMLTGDHEATARPVAEALGVDEFYAGLLPDEKVQKVRELEARYGRVAMVGDGVNDAPALAAANVGIAMGAAASDIALETADVAVMADDLGCLPYLFRLARRSGSVIRQNIAASIGIKLSLAAGVPAGWVSLITAVLVGDMGASLAVTGNALRLARLGRKGGR